jgi:hypothetical protein
MGEDCQSQHSRSAYKSVRAAAVVFAWGDAARKKALESARTDNLLGVICCRERRVVDPILKNYVLSPQHARSDRSSPW